MILTKDKALKLLVALDEYCKKHNVSLSKNKSIRYIELAKFIMQRYNAVILVSGSTKFICNSPKFLKKWSLKESLRNYSPLVYYTGYMKSL